MNTNKAKLRLDKDFIISEVDDKCFGSFVEPLGRCIYHGLYEPGHPLADETGFRTDVLEKTRDLNLKINRFPGGNYVSTYRWEDSIGPKDKRPFRADPAWFSIEPNQFGINEFVDWSERNHSEIMMTLNLATRGVLEAMDCVEYCNFPKGTYWSDLRISHGYRKPHGIKYWCLTNEIDGRWQIGQKPAREYGLLARETAKAIRLLDPQIRTVICGSSSPTLATFPAFDAEALEIAYEYTDYISIHNYLSDTEHDMRNFLAKPLITEKFLKEAGSVLDYVQAKVRSPKKVYLSFDEFNTWHGVFGKERYEVERWQYAPKLLEDQFNMGDALTLGGMLLSVLRNSDKVKIACMSEMVNCISHIRTENMGGCWVLPPYYTYKTFSEYGRGKSLVPLILETPKYDTIDFTDVPVLDAAATVQKDRLCVFAINRSMEDSLILEIEAGGFSDYEVDKHVVLTARSAFETNTKDDPDHVIPQCQNGDTKEGETILTRLCPLSWNVIILKRKACESHETN